jgi:hypothetical protein
MSDHQESAPTQGDSVAHSTTEHTQSQEQNQGVDMLDITPVASAASTRQPSPSMLPPVSHVPSQNRVFGLSKDLAGPSAESAHLLSGARNAKLRKRSSMESLAPSLAGGSLSKDLDEQDQDRASGSGGINGANVSPSGNDGPQFSVELIAPAFDKRGYPVFSGRASKIRGYLRMKPMEGCEIILKVSADAQRAPKQMSD